MILAWTGDKLLYRQAQIGINLDFQVKFDLEDQGQSTPKTTGYNHIKMHFWSKFGDSNLNGWKLSCRQAQKEVIFEFQVKFDLKGQGRSPPKIIGILSKVLCIPDPNLVILAWTADELSCGQASGWYTNTHGHTDRHTDAGDDDTRRPKLASGKNDSSMYSS